jgi:hypothetical protein
MEPNLQLEIQERLEDLGPTEAEVSYHLHRMLMRGVRGSPMFHPIARYLQQTVRRYVQVSFSHAWVDIYDQRIRVNLPTPVWAWRVGFDKGEYPSLESKGTLI